MVEDDVALWIRRHAGPARAYGQLPGPARWGLAWSTVLAGAGIGVAIWMRSPLWLSCLAGIAAGVLGPWLVHAGLWWVWTALKGRPRWWPMWIAMAMAHSRKRRARLVFMAWLAASELSRRGQGGGSIKIRGKAKSSMRDLAQAEAAESVAAWRLKLALGPQEVRMQCHCRALALSMAWGRGQEALQWRSILGKTGSKLATGGYGKAIQLAELADRWDATGADACWAPIRAKSDAEPEGRSGRSLDTLSFAEAFDRACSTCSEVELSEGLDHRRRAYLAQKERGTILESLSGRRVEGGDRGPYEVMEKAAGWVGGERDEGPAPAVVTKQPRRL